MVTITAYNKTVIAGGFGSTLAGGDPAYLVKRGYAQLTVDARGTGSSDGSWCAFCAREDRDAAEVMTWAHSQPWSNGSTAMTGASYMGISQIFAAAGKPAGLKAIFPQVPGADVYRDVVASGGQLDVGFMPLWLGLVTVTGLIPPAILADRPASGFSALAQPPPRRGDVHRPSARSRPSPAPTRPTTARSTPNARRSTSSTRSTCRPSWSAASTTCSSAAPRCSSSSSAQARRADQAGHRPVGPPPGLLGRSGR